MDRITFTTTKEGFMTEKNNNPLNMKGLSFIEFATSQPKSMRQNFFDLGFSLTHKLKYKTIYHYQQNNIHLLLNEQQYGFSKQFTRTHGPCVCSLGFAVLDSEQAYQEAIKRGAKSAQHVQKSLTYPAIFGVGESLIYFIDQHENKSFFDDEFEPLTSPIIINDRGFLTIDHLTNNVQKGMMNQWVDFYQSIFGFTEIRSFDINGVKTGLQSHALRSPDETFSIPINEGKGNNNNQIDEYLESYKGAGVQHIAFESQNIIKSLESFTHNDIETLDIHEQYYDDLLTRLPFITENIKDLKKHQILADGDEKGYLLQIFTKNLFGPIFLEIIQRKNNLGFGEGNFQALFESIERDQTKRGVL